MADDGDSRAPIVVRSASEPDLEIAGRISVAAYLEAGQLEPGSAYVEVLADAAARKEDALLLVAEIDGTVVGTVTLCPSGSRYREIGREGEVEFRFLAVDPPWWGRGVADALMDACADHARQAGASHLAICVRDSNMGAFTMYARRGFTRDPSRDWSPLPGVDLWALTRPVD